MVNDSIYRALVPDAPAHMRTEGDASTMATVKRRRLLAIQEASPGLQSPSLVSSYAGAIERVLFCFPAWGAEEPDLAAGYRSVIEALRPGTRFIVAHAKAARPLVEPWFEQASHPSENVEFVPLPDYVNLTDWAEDAYVALTEDGESYLMEPWTFRRGGDAMIADAVEEYTDVRASSAPLIFQGGNCLVGSDFWLLGKDYFADTIYLFNEPQPPVGVGQNGDPRMLATETFSRYVDATRRLILIGTRKPIPIVGHVGSKQDGVFYLDVAASGAGTFQPIFHIDMFLTLVGENGDGKFEVLVGSPSLADERLGTTSPFALGAVYDDIAESLGREGFVVRRNPLVHRSTLGRRATLPELTELTQRPGGESVALAIAQLRKAGADDSTEIQVRDWHHITWNNCLVENAGAMGKDVYLPTFGHEPYEDLAIIDAEMSELWESLGFTVHLLADFNPFARRQGVVHCIKKYVRRGSE
jgi:hypothetical protein